MEAKKKQSRNIAIFVASVFLLAYIGSQAFKIVNNPVETEVAYDYTIEDTVETDVFISRKEVFITNEKAGTIISAVDDGSRIAKGQAVAYVFTDPEHANTFTQLQDLQSEIERYTRLAQQSDNYVFDVDDLDLYIDNSVIDLVDAVDDADITHITTYVNELRDNVVTRQIATGSNFDFESRLSSLQAQYDTLSKKTINSTSITTNLSGYYVSGTDGYEETLDYDNITEITADDVDKALKADPAETPTGAIGKVITEFTWYFVCEVETNTIGNLEVGDTITINLPYSAVNTLKVQVAAINGGTGKVAVLVLSCNRMNSDISKLRNEKAELVVTEYEGIKVPSSAIRVNDEGEKGVYVLSGNIAKFKKLNIIYSTDDFVLSAAEDSTDDDYVRLYDKVIVNGKDLYDGKSIK